MLSTHLLHGHFHHVSSLTASITETHTKLQKKIRFIDKETVTHEQFKITFLLVTYHSNYWNIIIIIHYTHYSNENQWTPYRFREQTQTDRQTDTHTNTHHLSDSQPSYYQLDSSSASRQKGLSTSHLYIQLDAFAWKLTSYDFYDMINQKPVLHHALPCFVHDSC